MAIATTNTVNFMYFMNVFMPRLVFTHNEALDFCAAPIVKVAHT